MTKSEKLFQRRVSCACASFKPESTWTACRGIQPDAFQIVIILMMWGTLLAFKLQADRADFSDLSTYFV